MCESVHFALLPTLASKPVVLSSLDALARRIHRERREAPLQLVDHTVHLYGDAPEGRRMVGVYTVTDSGVQQGFIGWAWLNGSSWRALQTALFGAQPDTAVRAQAA